jgi:hypothetical protein
MTALEQVEHFAMQAPRYFLLFLTVVGIAWLVACARTDTNIYGGLNGQRVVGNETYVTITNVWNEMDALPLAERHCSQYGKAVKFARMEPARAVFDCVAK